MKLDLPKLNKTDYLKKDYEFWRKFRQILTIIIKEYKEEVKKEKKHHKIFIIWLKIVV